MKYTEKQLKAWTTPLSQSEETRAENAIEMIRSAIHDYEELNEMNIQVFMQGSYANNTNVWTESDVDVCIMLKDTFHCEYPEGGKDEDYGFTSSAFTFQEYRNLVKKALQEKFKYINDGNKSLKISENTYHVQADVVPVFQLRNYRYIKSYVVDNFVEGTWLVSKTGQEISNYPKVHIENGKNKNNITNHQYKALVRIMKHIKNNMVKDGKTDNDKITSFLVESLVWNVDNNIITIYNTWTETVKETIRYLYREIESGKHTNWGEVSEMLYLFHNSRKWTGQDVKQWLEETWDYLELE